MLLPVEFIRARERATVEYERLSPAAVVLLRQAGRRSAITPETTAKNEMNGKYSDNAGFWPEHIPVAEGGAGALRSTLPVENIVCAISDLGVPCEKSDDAGAFVCNSLFYAMLHHNKGSVPPRFIHVPYVREQGHEEAPFMESEDVYQAIFAAIEKVTRNEYRQHRTEIGALGQ